MSFKSIIFILFFTSTIAYTMNLNDINSASKEDLMKIKGIGEKKAIAIIKARPFKHMVELDNIKGVGASLMNNIKNDIYKSGIEPPVKQKKKINLFEK
ncbi:putative DNA uptake protein [Sulfurovum sp. enrichment culture clone C5]|uniref:Putative DNA uptake protein n=1 Tax=Sulfurovum sp. enrichment culture clone C5 TaxID=497650 RepID=A0A0S4XMH9_9BACT|nr:putative DNA uptake protein [Sulfurovum sp. enrichment culture clone C5]